MVVENWLKIWYYANISTGIVFSVPFQSQCVDWSLTKEGDGSIYITDKEVNWNKIRSFLFPWRTIPTEGTRVIGSSRLPLRRWVEAWDGVLY